MSITPDDLKDEIIRKQYYSKNGFRSPEGTYQDVRHHGITLAYVKDFFKRNFDRKKATGGGKNSFVAKRAHQEYQIDLFEITPNQMPGQEFRYGFSVIDIFSKRATVIPSKEKKVSDWIQAIGQSFKDLGGQPDMIITDKEGSLQFGRKTKLDPFFEETGIHYIQTASSAHFVERFNRTFKLMLQKRLDKILEDKEKGIKKRLTGKQSEHPQWHEFIKPILTQYNNQIKHSATGLTPMEASKPANEVAAKAAMEVKAMKARKYPSLNVGDKVRVLRKKVLGEKENVGNFKAGVHEVVEITHNLNQNFYRLDDGVEYLRADIVKLDR